MSARIWIFSALLFKAWLLVDTATFSSRMLHRFSDELRARRNLGGAWPENRRTLQYHHMLLSSDFQRQTMNLGSHHQLLFPSEGSKVVSFGNALSWLHYTWIDIGTPNVSFLVALDTGSDLLWVPCDCIQCAPLSASYYTVLDRDMNEYSPSGSSTSKHLSCGHQLCDLGSNCENPKQPCPYTANYNTENTSTSGLLVVDTLHLASASDDASNTSVQAPVVIGCAMKQSGSYLDGAAPDGLMGLGPGDISVPSFLSKAGLVPNSFSMCFREDDSGRIFFGDQGAATQQSTPFLLSEGRFTSYMVAVDGCCVGNSCLKKASFKAQVDSGTSFTFLPVDIFEAVAEEFDRRLNMSRVDYKDSPFNCYKTRSTVLPKIPSLRIMFSPNNSFVVQAPVFEVFDEDVVDGVEFCLGIQAVDGDIGVIGQNFMTGYRLVFDRESMKLGWSRSNCQDLSDSKRLPLNTNGNSTNPLPTNEQQRSYGRHAVAPAVAGRAPANKPSAASPRHSSGFVFRAVSMLLLLFHRHISFP